MAAKVVPTTTFAARPLGRSEVMTNKEEKPFNSTTVFTTYLLLMHKKWLPSYHIYSYLRMPKSSVLGRTFLRFLRASSISQSTPNPDLRTLTDDSLTPTRASLLLLAELSHVSYLILPAYEDKRRVQHDPKARCVVDSSFLPSSVFVILCHIIPTVTFLHSCRIFCSRHVIIIVVVARVLSSRWSSHYS